jgi:hypothetical protein
MSDIADSTTRIQTTSVENGYPVSESLMSQIGGTINRCLNKDDAQDTTISNHTTAISLLQNKCKAFYGTVTNGGTVGFSGTVIAAVVADNDGVPNLIGAGQTKAGSGGGTIQLTSSAIHSVSHDFTYIVFTF